LEFLLDLDFIPEDETVAGSNESKLYGKALSCRPFGLWEDEWSEVSENWIEPNFFLLGALRRNFKLWPRKMTRKEMGKRGLFTTRPGPPRSFNGRIAGGCSGTRSRLGLKS